MRSTRSKGGTVPRPGRGPTVWVRTALGATCVAALLAGAGTATGDPGSGAGPEGGTSASTTVQNAEPVTVTLISGDRVTVRSANDRHGVTIEPAKERRGDDVTFRRFSVDDHLYVIPSDLTDEVARGSLDRRLFDVTGLIELGYDDRHRDDLPLIVSYGSGGARTMSSIEGAEVTRSLPAVGGAAVSLDKSAAGSAARPLLAGVSARRDDSTRAQGSADIGRIWLDGRAELLLDQSVPQINAPQAWESGFTGEGVTVAVLDSGVDTSHPDLADAVTASQDFTGEGAEDRNGHGTHVASTITGSGAASDGRYQGVAPDAKLVSGKVCGLDGFCEESGILAAMEWAAADQGADIVNLSLGGTDRPGTDPLEAAIDELTERTGALFVVAAGNEGPPPESVSSPASADAALAVGAVDDSDQIPAFSSRGPRVGDGGIKPDITAPGFDIVAARAEGTEIGLPVGDSYVTASGTSMAAPHVAGAAAILAQQHPDWTAGELKAALMGSARPSPDWTVFDQGAGRVDVERAVGQEVFGLPGSLSFGRRLWPHDDDEPVTERLTYRNTGESDVTVTLSAELTDPEGAAAPEGAVSLSKDSLTISAGGTADVEVTLDTRHDGPDGVYSGQVTATGDVELVTPISVEKEVESYDLTIESVDREGNPAAVEAFTVGHADQGLEEAYSEAGATTIRLPKGDYLIDAMVRTGSGEAETLSQLVQPRLTLDRDRTWTADAREARGFSVGLDRPDAQAGLVDIGYTAQIAGTTVGSGIWSDTVANVFTGQVGPADDALTALFAGQWGRQAEDGSFANSPFVYALIDRRTGEYWNGYHQDVQDQDLARIRTSYASQSDRQVQDYMFASFPESSWSSSMGWRFDAPATAELFLSPGEEVLWDHEVAEINADFDAVLAMETPERAYEAGTYEERWNTAVFGPGLNLPDPTSIRYGNNLLISLPMYSDGRGNVGWSSVDSASTVLYRDGTKVAESEEPGLLEVSGLPEGEAEYVLEVEADRRSISELSGLQTARWTFASGAAAETVSLPLWSVHFAPRVNGENANQDRPFTLVPVTLESNPGAEVGDMGRPKVEFSLDDKRWRKAVLIPAGDDTWLALVQTAGRADRVSLRATAEDSRGNRVEQTIQNAFRLG